MELGDLAWDYTDAYLASEHVMSTIDRRMVIILEYPNPVETGRSAKVITLDGVIKNVPIEFLLPVW